MDGWTKPIIQYPVWHESDLSWAGWGIQFQNFVLKNLLMILSNSRNSEKFPCSGIFSCLVELSWIVGKILNFICLQSWKNALFSQKIWPFHRTFAGSIVFTMNGLVNIGMDHPKLLIIVCEVVGENAWGVDECGEGGEVGGVAGGGDGHQDVRRREPYSSVAHLHTN